MVTLTLNDEDVPVLKGLLKENLGDLRMEIADTDSKDFRDYLKTVEVLMKRLIAELEQ